MCVVVVLWHQLQKTPKIFFNNKRRLIVWKPSFLWQILYRNENRSLHHLTFDHPKKNTGVGSILWNVSIQAGPKYGWSCPKYLHDLENGSINFIESKTLPTTHLCFWQFTILYSRNQVGGFLGPGTWNIHNSLHPEVTGHTFRSRSKFKPPQLVQGVGFHRKRPGGFCVRIFSFFLRGVNMYEVVVIPRNLTYTPKKHCSVVSSSENLHPGWIPTSCLSLSTPAAFVKV